MGPEIWIIITGMALVTFTPRVLPFFLIKGEKLPPALQEWLRLLPIVIFASLVAPPLLVTGSGTFSLAQHTAEICVVLSGAATAYFTKKIPFSLGAAVVVLILVNYLNI